MPPRTRAKATKVLKENIDILKNSKLKSAGKVSKPSRKALADKTNSLSDDNASIDIPMKPAKTALKSNKAKVNTDNARPKRARRLPTRYVENHLLYNLSNNNNKHSPVKDSPVPYKSGAQAKKASDQTTTSLKVLSKTEGRSKVDEQVKKALENSDTDVFLKDEKDVSFPRRRGHILSAKENTAILKTVTPNKNNLNIPSPFKTPTKELESSLVVHRPKRICRLPSRFEDHSISPNKFIPVQPCHASTPIQKSVKTISKDMKPDNQPKVTIKTPVKDNRRIKTVEKPISKTLQKSKRSKADARTNASNSSVDKSSPDTNNNGKIKAARTKKANVKTKLQAKQVSPQANKITPFVKRILDKTLSFRILEDKSQSEKKDNLDVYEFTYDPNEEPPPQKKKRKRVVKNKPPKPKTIVLKSKYDKNVSKALANLKGKVKSTQEQTAQNNVNIDTKKVQSAQSLTPVTNDANINATSKINVNNASALPPIAANDLTSIHELNYASIRVEDIAADFDAVDNHDDINYSPVNSPSCSNCPAIPEKNVNTNTENVLSMQACTPATTDARPKNINVNCTSALLPVTETAKNSIHESNYAYTRVKDIAADFGETDNHDMNYSPVNSPTHPKTQAIPEINISHCRDVHNKDPLNLQGDLSFFDETPVASSSMNVSIRHPLASPWRVEFGSLPIKWHANTYVKPNMTPAVECSFITSEDTNKKKHVYTNIVSEANEPLPQLVENNQPNLIQTSIISFIKEVAEKTANKKKRGRSVTPTKANLIFNDVPNTANDIGYKTPKKAKKAGTAAIDSVSKSNEKENSYNSNKSVTPAKSQKEKDKDCTYFGFDDSENVDQENLAPVRNVHTTRARGLRPRSRAVLKEINAQCGPTRAAMPVTAKTKLTSSDVVNQVFEQLKATEDASQFPQKETAKEPANSTVTTNVEDPSLHADADEDSESVHLFEDIEIVHHLKLHRKSYGKAKKVTFRQPSNSDSETEDNVEEQVNSSFDDDLADLTFQMPNIKEKKPKKKKPKKKLSKKEEKEVEEWAAGFNSMCEDIDEFPLVVE